MFGFWESILSFLIRMVGLRTDAADAAGSLHAKTATIGTPNPGASGTDTLFKYLKKIDDKVLSVQRGQTSIGTGSAGVNVTITAVNTAKAFVSFGGSYSNRAGTPVANEDFAIAYLTSSTNLYVGRVASSTISTVTVAWEVVQLA